MFPYTHVYKWVPANILGVTLQWISIPSRGGCSNTPSHFMLRKPELSTSSMGQLGLYKGFTLLFYYCYESQIKLYLLVWFILLVINKGSDARVSNYKVQDYNFTNVGNHTIQYSTFYGPFKGLGYLRCLSLRLKLSLDVNNQKWHGNVFSFIFILLK